MGFRVGLIQQLNSVIRHLVFIQSLPPKIVQRLGLLAASLMVPKRPPRFQPSQLLLCLLFRLFQKSKETFSLSRNFLAKFPVSLLRIMSFLHSQGKIRTVLG